jgi:hypothetical protein
MMKINIRCLTAISTIDEFIHHRMENRRNSYRNTNVYSTYSLFIQLEKKKKVDELVSIHIRVKY